MIARESMMARLVQACPSFAPLWAQGQKDDYLGADGTLLEYVALGAMARHLVGLAVAEQSEEFPAVFAEVETLLLEGDDYVRQAMTVGLMEGLQNHASHSGLDPSLFLKWLGPESKHWWGRLNQFWKGEGWVPKDVALILEDDPERVTRFTKNLRVMSPDLGVICWRSAKKMIGEVDALLPYARLISLDHDLYPVAGDTEDPGDGLDVAKHLAERKPACPIIIHSSNGDRARMMAGEFELAGCPVKMIAPLGSDWIEAYWAMAVEKLLDQSKQQPQA